jgi:hypothetical protein
MALGWNTPFGRNVGYPGFASTVVIAAEGATYLIGEQSAGLFHNFLLSSDYSPLSLTGENANFLRNRQIVGEYSPYVLSVQSAGSTRSFPVNLKLNNLMMGMSF